jgi:ribosomal protein S18 acetylase RimI-like enzyme
VILPESDEWHELIPHFNVLPGARQIILSTIDIVKSSCGFSVPLYSFEGERDLLINWAKKQGADGLDDYRKRKNASSMDGMITPIGMQNLKDEQVTSSDLHISTIPSMTPDLVDGLTTLLINAVEDGASVGFISPISSHEASLYWSRVIQPGITLVTASVRNQIVGTVQLHRAMKDNGSHRAEVAKLMVHTHHRRNGIAKKLMQTIEDIASSEGRHLLVLDTRSGDTSNELYRSLGYIEAGRIPQFARSSNGYLEDTVYYYKELD